jgi:hypothetical protein
MATHPTAFAEIHQATQQLPPPMKMELIRRLFHEITPHPPETSEGNGESLTLTGLSNDELHILTKMMLPEFQQNRLDQLLEKNRTDELSQEENQELDELFAEIQRISIIKAKAIYTLQQRFEQADTE